MVRVVRSAESVSLRVVCWVLGPFGPARRVSSATTRARSPGSQYAFRLPLDPSSAPGGLNSLSSPSVVHDSSMARSPCAVLSFAWTRIRGGTGYSIP